MKDENAAPLGLLQNQYLQASHALLTWIEASKSSVERLIDAMPNAFAVLDAQGRVQRGNEALARLLGTGLEGCLDQPFVRLLSSEDARAFENAVARALSGPALNRPAAKKGAAGGQADPATPALRLVASDGATVRAPEVRGPVLVETALRGRDGVERHFVWQVSRFDGAHPAAQGWVAVFGNDVTALKTFQAKLARIFATLPIGVMQVDEDYRVVDPVSSRTGLLLGRAEVVGHSLHELLFEPCWDGLTAREKESTGLLHACLGASEIQFDLVKDDLPRLVRTRREGNTEETYLGLSFQPIVRDGSVRGFLVLVEDRTELEALTRGAEKVRRQEEADAARFAACARLDDGLLRAVRGDLESALSSGDPFPDRADALAVARVLHRLKGVGRFARLARLKDLCHALEEKVLAGEEGAPDAGGGHANRTWSGGDLDEVVAEARAVLLLARWMLEERCASHGRPPLVAKLEALAQSTADASGKRVALTCAWPRMGVERRVADALEEALVHVVTNAVDHGIEDPAARSRANKSVEGRIEISFHAGEDGLEVRVADDGAGVDRARVLARAVERGILREGAAAGYEGWLELLYEPRFSTRNEASETSGRGVGLSAARAAVEAVGGRMDVETEPGRGTTFRLRFSRTTDGKGTRGAQPAKGSREGRED